MTKREEKGDGPNFAKFSSTSRAGPMKVDSVWQKSNDHRAFLFLPEFNLRRYFLPLLLLDFSPQFHYLTQHVSNP